MRRLIVVAAMIAVILAAVAIFSKVETVSVEGNHRYGAEEILAVSELEPGGNLWTASERAVRASVKSAFPYIADVQLIRKFPDTLIIRVTEAEPAAKIQLPDGTFALISADGTVLSVEESIVTEGIMLTGLTITECIPGHTLSVDESSTETLNYVKELLQQLREYDLLGRVTYLQASIVNPKFDLDGKYVVEIGTRNGTDDKLSMLIRTLGELQDSERGRIVLSVRGEAHFIPN
ncbi:MAG: FtsQ-type POTRA domain-containing protein [Oscillospiraceae bacterium]|jgi:cell division protein FtsQ|nr:FtsQ-type POTRA domain-containing protein [Oscillospiraceae bacterium]